MRATQDVRVRIRMQIYDGLRSLRDQQGRVEPMNAFIENILAACCHSAGVATLTTISKSEKPVHKEGKARQGKAGRKGKPAALRQRNRKFISRLWKEAVKKTGTSRYWDGA